MQFYYIRHAQSTNNALYSQSGSDKGRSEDPELTELGLRQAELLANFILKNGLEPGINKNESAPDRRPLTHLYTSLMLRAVQTGSAVARATGIQMEALADIHECGGIYLDDEETGEPCGKPGKDRAFFAREYPQLVLPASVGEKGWWNRPFEVEEDRLPRARRFLKDLVEKHGGTDDRVAVVSHGGFYNEFLTAVLGQEKRNGVWFALYNTAISRIDFRGDEAEIVYLNRSDFLPREFVT